MTTACCLIVAFLFGGLTGFQDLKTYFRSRRISSLVSRHPPSWVFIAVNGLLASGFLWWALSSGSDSGINRLLHELNADSTLAKTLLISLAVPSILRSKLFEVGSGKTPVGLATIYDEFRDMVLHSLNSFSSNRKSELASTYSHKLVARNDLPDLLHEWVFDELRPFKTPAELAEIQKEFDSYREKHHTPEYSYTRYLRDLIRWSMDNAEIEVIRRKLARI